MLAGDSDSVHSPNAPSSSSECFHSFGDECQHPEVGGAATPSKCAECRNYAGRMRGFGDIVAAVTKVTGLDAIASRVSKDCGCGRRRAALNAALPLTDQRRTNDRVSGSEPSA